MKRIHLNIILALLTSVLLFFLHRIDIAFAQQAEEPKREVVYIYIPTCETCQKVAPSIATLEQQGVTVHRYDYTFDFKIAQRYRIAYNVPHRVAPYPLLYVGDQYFEAEDIIAHVEDGTIYALSIHPLKSIEGIEARFVDLPFLGVLGAGLIDGFNPCAIAMLLLFISLLTFMKNRRLLIIVCFSYILGIFLSYLAFGTILFQFIHYIGREARIISRIIAWAMLLLSAFFFFFNLYDGIMSYKKKYGKVKNQLPKRIQAFNKRITVSVTRMIERYQQEGKSVLPLILWTFGLGFVLAFTEFMCTGQIYLPTIVALVQLYGGLNVKSWIYLISYNVMFVLPLIVIAIVAIRTQSIMVASDKVREHLHYIKFFNAAIFLVIFIYYLMRII